MTTEVHDFLTGPWKTERKIRELESRVKGLESAMLPGAVSYDKDKVQAPYIDAMARFAEKVDGLLDDILALKARYLREVSAVSDSISRLDDPDERTVLSMRYLQRKRYEDIADGMFYGLTKVYALHRRGTQKIKVRSETK